MLGLFPGRMHTRPLNQALVLLGFLHMIIVICNCCLPSMFFLHCNVVAVRFVFITSQLIGGKDQV